jgi:hypothetical protein
MEHAWKQEGAQSACAKTRKGIRKSLKNDRIGSGIAPKDVIHDPWGVVIIFFSSVKP